MSSGFVPCVGLTPSVPVDAPFARRNVRAVLAVAKNERTDSRFVQQSSELKSRSSDASARGSFYATKPVPERRIEFTRAAFHFEVSSGGLFRGWGLDANDDDASSRKRDTYGDNSSESFDPDSFGNERNGYDSGLEDAVKPSPSAGVVLEIMEPLTFDQSTAVKAIQALKDRKLVILNLGTMPIDQAQQMHNFISGGCYALGGQQRYLAENIFFFGPAWVQINEWTARNLAEAASQSPNQSQSHTYSPPTTPSSGMSAPPSIFSRSLTSEDDL
mmetsp:Transcript_16122/g.27820  ORF Transcript_16122/g.27820 Transcript_16122/m.27820 type:complete len:273 (+) Transcript_16122:101-919(+)